MELHRDIMAEDEDDQEINVDTDSRCSATADDESRSSSFVDGVRSCSATGSDGGGSLLSPGSEHNRQDTSPANSFQHLHRRRLEHHDGRSLTPSPPPSSASSAGQVLPFSISRLLGADFEANNNSVNGSRHGGISATTADKGVPALLLHPQGQHEAITSLYTHPAIVQFSGTTSGVRTSTPGGLCPVSAGLPTAALAAAGLVYNTAAGVIRVPAHRPAPPPPLGGPAGGGTTSVPALAAPFPWLAAASMDPTSLQRSAAAAAFASHVVKERLTGRPYT
jgi:hypothetical protein